MNDVLDSYRIITNYASTRVTTMERGTTIIFDWDDTLCPTSFLAYHRMAVPATHAALMKELQKAVIDVLSMAAHYGSAYIVTNAEHRWVMEVCETHMPLVGRYLQENKDDITIISARDTYQALHPDDPGMWKQRTIGTLVASKAVAHQISHATVPLHIIGVGDMKIDQDALLYLCSPLNDAELPCDIVVKTTKLAERPTLDGLLLQLQIYFEELPNLVVQPGHIDMTIIEFIETLPPLPSRAPITVSDALIDRAMDDLMAGISMGIIPLVSTASSPLSLLDWQTGGIYRDVDL